MYAQARKKKEHRYDIYQIFIAIKAFPQESSSISNPLWFNTNIASTHLGKNNRFQPRKRRWAENPLRTQRQEGEPLCMYAQARKKKEHRHDIHQIFIATKAFPQESSSISDTLWFNTNITCTNLGKTIGWSLAKDTRYCKFDFDYCTFLFFKIWKPYAKISW